MIGQGLLVLNFFNIFFLGMDTTAAELMVFDGMFKLTQSHGSGLSSKLKDIKLESFI